MILFVWSGCAAPARHDSVRMALSVEMSCLSTSPLQDGKKLLQAATCACSHTYQCIDNFRIRGCTRRQSQSLPQALADVEPRSLDEQ